MFEMYCRGSMKKMNYENAAKVARMVRLTPLHFWRGGARGRWGVA